MLEGECVMSLVSCRIPRELLRRSLIACNLINMPAGLSRTLVNEVVVKEESETLRRSDVGSTLARGGSISGQNMVGIVC